MNRGRGYVMCLSPDDGGGAGGGAASRRVEALPNGTQLIVGSDPDQASSMSTICVDGALDALRSFMETRQEIESDRRLSSLGKSERLDPVRDKAATVIANLWASLDGEESHIAKTESDFYAVPAIDPKNAGDAMRDREVRDYVRGLSEIERAKLLAEVHKGGQEGITLALLRSPIPLGDAEKVAADSWRTTRRMADPGFVERIAVAKASVEWGRRNLLQIGAVFKSTTKLEVDQLYRSIAGEKGAAKGYGVFGISQPHAEQMQRAIAGRKLLS